MSLQNTVTLVLPKSLALLSYLGSHRVPGFVIHELGFFPADPLRNLLTCILRKNHCIAKTDQTKGKNHVIIVF